MKPRIILKRIGRRLRFLRRYFVRHLGRHTRWIEEGRGRVLYDELVKPELERMAEIEREATASVSAFWGRPT